MALSINTYGSAGEGYGAILRDLRMRPIVASCGSLSPEDGVSIFYTWLNGVALGAKIAAKYRVLRLYLYVPSERLYFFIREIWDPYYRGSMSESYVGSKSHLESICRPEDKDDIEKIYCLTSAIISDLNELPVSGVKFYSVESLSDPFNEAAIFLSKLSVDKQDMKVAEICADERLSDILYEDVWS